MVMFLKSRIVNAIDRQDIPALEALLESAKNVDLDLGNGKTPLYVAAEDGKEEVVDFLLKKGAKLDVTNGAKWTPLHRAAYYGRLGTVVKLLKAGADPNLRTNDGRSALSMAERGQHNDIAEVIRPFMKKTSELFDLPAPPAAVPLISDDWKKLPGERIAHVAVEEAIGYRMTEIFNFAAREKTTLWHNLETKSETVETRGFDELGDRRQLEEALAQLQARGGKSDASSISGLDKKRLAPSQ